jgi:hypothetical protein
MLYVDLSSVVLVRAWVLIHSHRPLPRAAGSHNI